MKYGSIGTSTSGSEVTDVSRFGIWILHRGKEYFLDYEQFPWFLDAPVSKVFLVVDHGPEHLYWPELDVDLSLDSIRYPGAFPLVYEPPGPYREHSEARDAEKPPGGEQAL